MTQDEINQSSDGKESNNIVYNYILQLYNKFRNLDLRIQEGIYLLICGLIVGLPLSFWSKYVPEIWLYFIIFDLFIFAFIYINEFEFEFGVPLINKITIGKNSIFTPSSLFYRAGRILIYLLLVKIYVENYNPGFFINFLTVCVISFWIYAFYIEYRSENPTNKISAFLQKYNNILMSIFIIVILGTLGVILRLYNVHDMGGWDEGWYSNISYIMKNTENWFQPIYYDDRYANKYLLFDKPPLMFILASVWVELFGFTSFAAKLSMGLFSGLMGVAGYFIYAHQKRVNKIKLVQSIERTESEIQSYDEILGDEDESKVSDGKFIGIIFGLSMAVVWFLVFYGRTAYLDAAIVAFTAFTALFAIKTIDHFFYGNYKKAYIYLVLTAIINMIDLLLKAWQGLIVGPSIALYLFARFYEHMVPKNGLHSYYIKIKLNFFSAVNNYFTEILASISAIIAFLSYSSISEKNYLEFSLLDIKFDIWALIISIFIFLLIRSIINTFLDTNRESLNARSLLNLIEEKNYFALFIKISIIIIFIFTAIVSGLLASILGNMGFEFLFERLYVALTQISEKYFTISEDIETRIFLGELILGFLSTLVALLLIFIIVNIFFIIIFGVMDVFYYFIKREFLFENSYSTKILSEWSVIIPISFFGVAIGYWAYFLLFKGEFFDRNLQSLLLAGVLLSFLAYLLASMYIEVLRYFWVKGLKKEENDYFIQWNDKMSKFLIFMTIMSILIILSFFPFLSWIEYMDTEVVNNPLILRIPGELANDPREICVSIEDLNNPNIDCKPSDGQLTYKWLFYVYYIGWRYGGFAKYSVVDSLGGLLGPLFLASIPFFITGIYAFHKKRDYSNLLFYLSWLIIVLLTFLPATFQLNYYYLAIFFPYFGISSFGMFWAFRKTKSGIHFRDLNEKLLLSLPILVLLFFSHIYYPYINDFRFLVDDTIFLNFVLSLLVLIIGYLAFVVLIIRTIPGAFSLAFVMFYFHKYYVDHGFGQFDSDLLLISIVLVALSLYVIRERIPLQSAFFLFLIIITAATASAWWTNYKSDVNDGYEKMGTFILDHGGNYNESTWVFPETGARFAMRFYLGGLNTANDRGHEYPFSGNSSVSMENFMISNPNIKFFIVTNTSYWENKAPTSAYTESYIWLKNNFIWVNPLLDKPDWHHIHLFVNATVLSPFEINQLTN